MKQATFATIFGWFLWGLVTTASGQNSHHTPKIPHPGDKTVGAELVLWTPTQVPKPVSESAPAKKALPADSKLEAVSPENSAIQSSISETLVGEVVKTGNIYALATADTETYMLESQDELRIYEGKVVKIVGEPSLNRNLIHVLSIAPVSPKQTPPE
jgi:DNA/RNA endonuclease YhcR with UshA esterase domain